MKNKRNVLYSLIIMLAGVINFSVQAQQKNGAQDAVETKDVSTSHGPNGIVRTIKQDRKGNIWIKHRFKRLDLIKFANPQ